MTRFFKFVGPMLRYVADAADKNPKTNTGISSLIVVALGALGLSPENLAGIGGTLIKLGKMMGGS